MPVAHRADGFVRFLGTERGHHLVRVPSLETETFSGTRHWRLVQLSHTPPEMLEPRTVSGARLVALFLYNTNRMVRCKRYIGSIHARTDSDTIGAMLPAIECDTLTASHGFAL